LYILVCSLVLGDDFPNAASLIETVLELQTEREQTTASNAAIPSVLPSSGSAASMPEGW